MDEIDWRRVRGLKRLLHDGVTLGTAFVERHHRRAVHDGFRWIESLAPVPEPLRRVWRAYDAVLVLTYGGVRTVNRVAELLDDRVVDLLEAADGADDRPRRLDTPRVDD